LEAFGISGGGVEHQNPPPRYATGAQFWLFQWPAKCSRPAGCDDPLLCCTPSLCVGTVTSDVSSPLCHRPRRRRRQRDDRGGQFVTKDGTAPAFTATIKLRPSVCRFARHAQKTTALPAASRKQSRKHGNFHAPTSIRYDSCCSEIYHTRSFSSTPNTHFLHRNSHNLSKKV
jgi:hypothetical protein